MIRGTSPKNIILKSIFYNADRISQKRCYLPLAADTGFKMIHGLRSVDLKGDPAAAGCNRLRFNHCLGLSSLSKAVQSLLDITFRSMTSIKNSLLWTNCQRKKKEPGGALRKGYYKRTQFLLSNRGIYLFTSDVDVRSSLSVAPFS